MKKLFAFIFWPGLAGLMFAFALLQAPRLVSVMPGLAAYFPQPAATPQPVAGLTSFSAAIRKSAPAVVSINYQETTDFVVGRLTNQGFRPESVYKDKSNSLGSGVIVHPDGYIITSYHVIFTDNEASRTDIAVTLHDGRTLEARIVSADEKNDLALLKVDAENLPTLPPADTGQLQRGDIVLAIGNPRNVGQSVTLGIISALWRRDDTFVIQTDAAINPGNSGGALIDVDGNLIGINSTIVSESGGSEGIGFSIPAENAERLFADYIASGPRGYLGVTTAAISLEQGRSRFGQDVQGFQVQELLAGGAAEKAGIQVGDVLTAVDGKKLLVPDAEVLLQDEALARETIAPISDLPASSRVVIEVFRDGEFLQFPTELGVGDPRIFRVLEEVEPSQPSPGIAN